MSELIQINPQGVTGKNYWRSLDAIEQNPEFVQWVEREFQENASEMLDNGSRRNLLKLMAASFGLAGAAACRRPVEPILPHAKGLETVVHGNAVHYATAATTGGAATGLIVQCHDGRPTKVEGNPRHPYSLGATNAHAQALLLSLYDPDRARHVHRGANRSSWDEFFGWAQTALSPEQAGSGMRVLAERSSSPTLEALRGEVAKRFPAARWLEFDAVSFDNPRAGAEMAFGQPMEPHYQFQKADVVLALDADFLGLDSVSILPVKQFSAKRKVETPESAMNRLYAAESNYTLTGAMADHRVRARASEIGTLALALAKELNVSGAELKVLGNAAGVSDKFVAAVAKDLAAHRGRSLVIAGPRQPAAVHALVALINQALGNTGETVVYTRPVVAESAASLKQVQELTADLNSGKVTALFLIGGNPVYSLPADLSFGEAVKKAKSVVALTQEANETWNAAEWRLPETHPFEAWGDARALNGLASIQQPLIAPLHDGKPAIEIAGFLARGERLSSHDLVQTYWSAQWGGEAKKRWQKALYDGFVEGTEYPAQSPAAEITAVLAKVNGELKAAPEGWEAVFFPSAATWDGRYANNAWMQEAPDPMTKLVWDNAALISPASANELGVKDGDYLAISVNGREIKAPAMIQPGHADKSVSLSLGYGRAACGRVGQGVGHSVEPLRTVAGFHIAGGATVRKDGGSYQLVTTQEHHSMEGRAIVLESALATYREHPDTFEHMVHSLPRASMYSGFDYSQGYQWGMAIDLTSCIGCNACVVACQAENNIPVVGKEQVRRGREMHWIRMDRYYTGSEEDPQVVTQPMACQQCENAPCEAVCPVAATVHSPEGLNDMAYNRCVGTRYCANNCPYKVRRFNFFNYHKAIEETSKMVFNPDVTVRMRGVMEKCTYCVQRIQEKKIEAKADGRRTLRDGQVVTACQQVCPADAIVFGNINDPESRVAKLKKQERDYELLEDLNTRPRTTYLAKLRNPNPELA
ncbi:MAG: TAT-variant-translocated molybdopterin oxidoreductase [Bryobacteraceae bacterium]|nr:TAT-variant-translocated molybdopterin oxidoreductase [Bryobacteraceae bacterium]